jgi:hypothetical protein
MEVCNGDEHFPDGTAGPRKNLTMLGNSDIHDPDQKAEAPTIIAP